MRYGTPQIASFKRTIFMLDTVIVDAGASSVLAIARQVAMPIATAHRQIATLVAEGYLTPIGRGRHVAGPRLLCLLHRLDEKQVIALVATPVLHKLAVRARSIVQLGTLENDMVTYRIKTGPGATGLFTKVGMQLEAYCSGIGKMLLAHLPAAERQRYLKSGPFVALTERTITAPGSLAEELARIRDNGYALDLDETAEGLSCLAVGIRTSKRGVPAAISVSQTHSEKAKINQKELLSLLQAAAQEIERAVFFRADPGL